ncbi:MAG: hypothetical protein RLZZ199_716 [Actinomycetota bacterium]|jgi:hypothetical protein
MGSVRRHAILASSADTVWAFIGRPEVLHEWFPTSSTRVEGDKRWVTLPSGIVFEEQILLVDNDLRRFQYSIINNPLITHHVGTVDVIALANDRCIVIYGTDIEPEVLGLAIGAAAGDGLRALQERFGKG